MRSRVAQKVTLSFCDAMNRDDESGVEAGRWRRCGRYSRDVISG